MLDVLLDGRRCRTLAGVQAELARALGADPAWAPSPDALDPDALGELLRGPGAAPRRLRLVWRDAGAARAALGYAETVRTRTRRLRDCPPHVFIKSAWALRAALRGEGPTLFDEVVAAVRARPGVELVLA